MVRVSETFLQQIINLAKDGYGTVDCTSARIINAADAEDPQDLVTLSQLQSSFGTPDTNDLLGEIDGYWEKISNKVNDYDTVAFDVGLRKMQGGGLVLQEHLYLQHSAPEILADTSLLISSGEDGAGGSMNFTSGDADVGNGGSINFYPGDGTGYGGSFIVWASNTTGSGGGSISLMGGHASAINSSGGGIYLDAGNSTGTNGDGGPINIFPGDGDQVNPGGVGGLLQLIAGTGYTGGNINIQTQGTNTSGSIIVQTGPGPNNSSGSVSISTGNGLNSSSISIYTGYSSNGLSGSLNFSTGQVQFGSGAVGSISFATGTGTGTSGNINLSVGQTSGTLGGSVSIQAGRATGGDGQGGNVNISSGTGDYDGDINLQPSNGLVKILGDGYVQNDFEIAGKLTVGGLIDPTGLVLDVQPSVPGGTPSAGKATLWVRDSDGYAVLTDENGNDVVIGTGSGGGGGGGESLSETLALGNTTGGTDILLTDGSVIATQGGDNLTLSTSAVANGGSITVDPADGIGNGSGGSINLFAGIGAGSGQGGTTNIQGGTGGDTGGGGSLNLTAGSGGATSGYGGSVSLNGGASNGAENAGSVNISAGNANDNGDGGNVVLTAGTSSGGAAGSIFLISTTVALQPITTLDGSNLNINTTVDVSGNGGSINIEPSNATGSGSGGSVNLLAGDGSTSGGGGTANLFGGSGGTTGAGGPVNIIAGNGGSVSGNGGSVSINSGDAAASGSGGSFSISSGDGIDNKGGDFTITVGNGTGTNAGGGDLLITTGNSTGTGDAGDLTINPGDASGSGVGGGFFVSAGSSVSGQGGSISLFAGNGSSGGNVSITAGNDGGSDWGDVAIIGDYINLTGYQGITLNGTVSASSNRITNVLDPVNPQDTATKAWVEAQIAAIQATANGTSNIIPLMSGVDTHNGYDTWKTIGSAIINGNSYRTTATLQSILFSSDAYSNAQVRLWNFTTSSQVGSVLETNSLVDDIVEGTFDLDPGENVYEIQIKPEIDGYSATCLMGWVLVDGYNSIAPTFRNLLSGISTNDSSGWKVVGMAEIDSTEVMGDAEFETIIWTSDGYADGYARLYNVTTSSVVGSGLTTITNEPTLLSESIILAGGSNIYEIQVKVEQTGTGEFVSCGMGRIKITGPTTNERIVLPILSGISTNETNVWTDVGFVEIDPSEYTYNNSIFEVLLSSTDGYDDGYFVAEARLYNVTTQSVIGTAVTSESNLAELLTQSVTLTAGSNLYAVQIRLNEDGGGTEFATCSMARIKLE